MTQTLPAADLAAYVNRWNAAREARDHQRRDPYSYLAYAGFHQLTSWPARFDAIPGEWRTGVGGPAVELSDGEELLVDGQVIIGSHEFAPVREREFRRAAQIGDVIIELSKRGGQDLLRPIDPAVGRRANAAYRHTPAYAPDFAWIVEGRFLPFPSIRLTEVDATIGGIVHVHSAIGEVEFTLGGVEHRWLVLARDGQDAGSAGTGLTLFTDATNGVATDAKGRSLEVDFPAGSGPVTLDFNFARNLQRPYTAFAPCPLAPAQNSTPLAVVAGDQLPVFDR